MSEFVPGDYNAVCDVCGFEFKASKLRRRWDNMMVCKTDWEPRHPQDTIRSRPEHSKPPWTRPEGTDSYITVAEIDTEAL